MVRAADFEEASVITTHVDQQLLNDMPLNGRSLQTLLLLTPGVVVMANNEFSFNGQSTNMNYFTVDGVSVNMAVSGGGASTDLAQDAGYSALGTTTNLISVNALDEFTVQSSTISPQIGRQSGGHVQMSSFSGGEKLHGQAFEYFRNSGMDASDWFIRTDTAVNTNLQQNDFGGVLSGAIPSNSDWLRHSYFFVTGESLHLFQPTALNTYVPSNNLRSHAPSQLQPFLNVFPKTSKSEIAGTGTSLYHLAIANPALEDSYSFRIDTDSARRIKLFTRYNYSNSSRTSTDSGWCLSAAERSFESSTTGMTWRPNQHVVHDLRFNFSENTGNIVNQLHRMDGASIPPDKVLLQGVSSKVRFPSLNYYFLGIGYSSKSTGQNPIHQINIVDNTSILRGKNLFGFGFDVLYLIGETVPSDFGMTVNFLSQSRIESGIADSVAIQSQDDVRVMQRIASLYAQNSWRTTRRFSLDYGMRWDLNPPPKANNGQPLYTVTSSRAIADMTIAPAGTPLYPSVHSDLSPRAGLSWMLRNETDRETILHSGVGVFYSLGNTNSMASASTFPHVRQITLYNRPYPPSSLLPIPSSDSLTPPFSEQTFYAFAHGYSTPVVYQFSLGLEQHLGAERKVSVAYVGSVSRHLPVLQQLVDPNKNFKNETTITEVRSEGVSSYDSLQAQYTQRLARGLHALASYTWAHSIDDISNDLNGFPRKVLIPIAGERSNSDFDLRQNAGVALNYQMRMPESSGFAGKVLDHWSFGAVATGRGGMPLDVTYTRLIGSQLMTARPDRVSNSALLLTRPQQPWGKVFNYRAFVVPSTAGQGDVGRNSLRGYRAWQTNISVHRSFTLTNFLNLEGRAEFFNVFNHPNFGDADMNLGTYSSGKLTRNPNFGYISKMLNTQLGGLQQSYQVGGPRSIQVSFKLIF
jgi:hypothetical protein